MWLGVAWLVDPVTYQNPRFAGPLQPVIDAFKPLENATYKGVLQGVGVQGANSSPTTSGITMPEPVKCPCLLSSQGRACCVCLSVCVCVCVFLCVCCGCVGVMRLTERREGRGSERERERERERGYVEV
jgi:hypothetical protein